jgi:hypothetical protein
MIASSPRQFRYDEVFHIAVVQKVKEVGWRSALVSPENVSAAGPLYAAIQLAAAPLTALRAPAIRWVNFSCLIAVMLLLIRTTAYVPETNRQITTSLLAVPFLWPAVSMALTELPALLAFTLFIFWFVRLLTLPDILRGQAMVWATLAGLSLGLSILGRQTYLIVVPSVLAMALWAPKKSVFFIWCAITAIVVCGWLFVLWGGLVPPAVQHVESSLRLGHGMLSLSYVAAATLFLNWRWLLPRNGKTFIFCVLAGVVLAFVTRDYQSPPAKSVLVNLLGVRAALFVGFGIGCALAALGILWLWNTLERAWSRRREPCAVFMFLTLYALVAAPIKIAHLFSSRYVVGLLGVLVLLLGTAERPANTTIAIIQGIGSIVGAALAWTYFQSPSL